MFSGFQGLILKRINITVGYASDIRVYGRTGKINNDKRKSTNWPMRMIYSIFFDLIIQSLNSGVKWSLFIDL